MSVPLHSDQLLARVLDQLPIGVWVADREGRIAYGNRAGRAICGAASPVDGVERCDQCRARFADSGEPIAGAGWSMARALAGETASPPREILVEGPDGECRALLHSAFVLCDESGERVGGMVVIEDVGERRAALARVQESLEEAQRIAHLGNWDWDIVGNSLWWSDEVYRIFGLAPQQFGATYEAFLERVHPEDVAAVQSAVDLALVERRPYDMLHRIRLPDGGERTVHERAEVTFGERGAAVRMIGTVQDVTESEAARASLSMLSSALEQTAEHVVVTDVEGRIQYVNAAFVAGTGYAADEVLGRTPRCVAWRWSCEPIRRCRWWTSTGSGSPRSSATWSRTPSSTRRRAVSCACSSRSGAGRASRTTSRYGSRTTGRAFAPRSSSACSNRSTRPVPAGSVQDWRSFSIWCSSIAARCGRSIAGRRVSRSST